MQVEPLKKKDILILKQHGNLIILYAKKKDSAIHYVIQDTDRKMTMIYNIAKDEEIPWTIEATSRIFEQNFFGMKQVQNEKDNI